MVVGSSPTVGVGTHDACSCASVTAAVVHFETHSLCLWCFQGHSVLYLVASGSRAPTWGPHVLGGPKLLRFHCSWIWSSWPATRHAAHRWAGGAEARLAQSVERKALNLVVVGSSPTVGVLVPDTRLDTPMSLQRSSFPNFLRPSCKFIQSQRTASPAWGLPQCLCSF